MSSSIVVRTKYQKCSNLRHSVSKTISYISDKKKADATSVDENDLLKDYLLFANNDSCLYEDKECFTWSMNGDIDAKRDLIEINKLDSKGTLWSLVISFPPDFAINNGLITKQDYFQLTKNIIPTLLSEMGLKLNNVSWYCSLHRNTNNPHLHINFYEHHKTISDPSIPYSCIHNLKSNIANYLIDNEKFYRLRDQEFTKITGDVNLKELTKIKNQKLFGDKYRKELNSKLVDFYSILPKTGRLQYNSKNMKLYKNELDDIIKYILMHDSVKYNYSKYLRLLDEHQKELTAIYGESSSNKNKNYYENQLNKLYSKIGNEILFNYKIYQSTGFMNREKDFISKHINDLKFKSRDYKKQDTINDIAKELYKICQLANLNYNQTLKVFTNWIKKSNYNQDPSSLLRMSTTLDTEMSTAEYYNVLKKLGYNSDRYNKIKEKYFYQELNYKKFINQAMNYLSYELEREEKEIINQIEHELGDY
jgi:hypothetical protein